jgi:hypothetical protein
VDQCVKDMTGAETIKCERPPNFGDSHRLIPNDVQDYVTNRKRSLQLVRVALIPVMADYRLEQLI